MAEKSFMELVSSDDKVKIEVLTAGYKALAELAISKGFKDEAEKVNAEAIEKVAEAHGYKTDEMTELNDGQLGAVAGGFIESCPFGVDKDPCGILGDGPCPSGISFPFPVFK
ncbi:MAG: hypothetical protein IJU48_05800 [Synergistaceae bacterium]|nr:hypothetical protein [Synergistaceae bacterium]